MATTIIAFMNQKGGVGKTTATINCAGALRNLKKKVLLIDLDSQANLSDSYGIKAEGSGTTVYELLKGDCAFAQAVRHVHGIDIIPSSIELANGEVDFLSEPGREQLLKRAIGRHAHSYNYILVDCPPHLGVLPQNAMTFADRIIIVLRPDNYSILGTAQLMKVIEVIRERINPRLQISGLLANGFDIRNRLDQDALEFLQKKFPKLIFKNIIRTNVRLREAPARQGDVFTYDPKSTGAEDFTKFAKELMHRIQLEN